jgi:hypothetical protein
MLKNIKTTIMNLIDYARCIIQSRAARYRVYYIESEIGDIGGVRIINFKIHPVYFDKGDFIGGLSAAEPKENHNIVDTDGTQEFLYDRINNMVYLIEMRLFGGESGREGASVIDARHHCNKKVRLMGTFLGKMAAKEGFIRIGSTRNAPPVMYKSIVGNFT